MSKQISLKHMLAEGFAYDVGTEKNSFEASVASATEAAKKKFEESMKQKVVGQKVKCRASRGQPGQPEKDYVIEKVSAASIDWYWKQYVVVFKDEKNKEYFLKPGFKVEVLTAAQPGQQPTNQTPAEPKTPAAAPQAPKAPAAPKANAPTQVTPQAAGMKNATKAPVAEDRDPWEIKGTEPGEIYVLRDGDQMGGPFESEEEAKDWMYDKQQQLPESQAPVAEAHQEYKKEWAAQIIGEILFKFLSPQKQADPNVQRNPTAAVLPYIKSSKWVGDENGDPGDGDHAQWILEIPVEDLAPDVDLQDLKLEFSSELRSSAGEAGGQYSRGYADAEKIGRLYRITIDYTVGLDV